MSYDKRRTPKDSKDNGEEIMNETWVAQGAEKIRIDFNGKSDAKMWEQWYFIGVFQNTSGAALLGSVQILGE